MGKGRIPTSHSIEFTVIMIKITTNGEGRLLIVVIVVYFGSFYNFLFVYYFY